MKWSSSRGRKTRALEAERNFMRELKHPTPNDRARAKEIEIELVRLLAKIRYHTACAYVAESSALKRD